jgi:hypothetical protein
MRRGRAFSIIPALLLAFVLVGAFVTQWEALTAWWRHQTVRKLEDPAQREVVYRQIVQWQRYRGVPWYTVDPMRPGESIRDVIVCHQRDGRPLYAVVYKGAFESDAPGLRRFELVDFDGTLVSVFEGWNFGHCDFKDLNADGVLDRLETLTYEIEEGKEDVQALTLIPMTPEQKVKLRVFYRMHQENAGWDWTVVDTNGSPLEIRLGPRDPETKELMPRAVYRWDPSRSEYVGPSGGIDEEFLRLDDLDFAKFEDFARRGR